MDNYYFYSAVVIFFYCLNVKFYNVPTFKIYIIYIFIVKNHLLFFKLNIVQHFFF